MPIPFKNALTALAQIQAPERLRGTGEGHYPRDLRTDSSMTNATVANLVDNAGQRTLTLRKQGWRENGAGARLRAGGDLQTRRARFNQSRSQSIYRGHYSGRQAHRDTTGDRTQWICAAHVSSAILRRKPRTNAIGAWFAAAFLSHFFKAPMSNHIYQILQLTGSSTLSSDDAIQQAIAKAAQGSTNVRWFEVVETRGQVQDGKVAHWQVTIKVGQTLD